MQDYEFYAFDKEVVLKHDMDFERMDKWEWKEEKHKYKTQT